MPVSPSALLSVTTTHSPNDGLSDSHAKFNDEANAVIAGVFAKSPRLTRLYERRVSSENEADVGNAPAEDCRDTSETSGDREVPVQSDSQPDASSTGVAEEAASAVKSCRPQALPEPDSSAPVTQVQCSMDGIAEVLMFAENPSRFQFLKGLFFSEKECSV